MEVIQQFIQTTLNQTEGNLTYMDICRAFDGVTPNDAQNQLQIYANKHNEYKTMNIHCDKSEKEWKITSTNEPENCYMIYKNDPFEYLKKSMNEYFHAEKSKMIAVDVVTTEHVFQSNDNNQKEEKKPIEVKKRKSFVISKITNDKDEEKKPEKIEIAEKKKNVVKASTGKRNIMDVFAAAAKKKEKNSQSQQSQKESETKSKQGDIMKAFQSKSKK